MKNSSLRRKAINTFVHLIKINPVCKKYLLLFLFFVSGFVQAQKLKKEDKLLLANLQHHIQFLADDRLEGRRTGTPGRVILVLYVVARSRRTVVLGRPRCRSLRMRQRKSATRWTWVICRATHHGECTPASAAGNSATAARRRSCPHRSNTSSMTPTAGSSGFTSGVQVSGRHTGARLNRAAR